MFVKKRLVQNAHSVDKSRVLRDVRVGGAEGLEIGRRWEYILLGALLLPIAGLDLEELNLIRVKTGNLRGGTLACTCAPLSLSEAAEQPHRGSSSNRASKKLGKRG